MIPSQTDSGFPTIGDGEPGSRWSSNPTPDPYTIAGEMDNPNRSRCHGTLTHVLRSQSIGRVEATDDLLFRTTFQMGYCGMKSGVLVRMLTSLWISKASETNSISGGPLGGETTAAATQKSNVEQSFRRRSTPTFSQAPCLNTQMSLTELNVDKDWTSASDISSDENDGMDTDDGNPNEAGRTVSGDKYYWFGKKSFHYTLAEQVCKTTATENQVLISM